MTATIHPIPVKTPDPPLPAIPDTLIPSLAASFLKDGVDPETVLAVSRRCGLPPEWAAALARSMAMLEASGLMALEPPF